MSTENINRDELENALYKLESAFESYAADEAIDKAVEALHLSLILADRAQEARARTLLGIGLRKLSKHDESIVELQEAIGIFSSLGGLFLEEHNVTTLRVLSYEEPDEPHGECLRERYIVASYELANSHLIKQEFLSAQRLYEQVIEQTVGDNSLQTIRGKSLVYLASTFYYLGEITKARITYLKALAVVSMLDEPEVVIDIYLGLGWMHFEEQNRIEAIEATECAKVRSEQLGGYRLMHILHNLGAMYLADGRPDDAYRAWEHCMQRYRETGDTVNQVSLYEEMASYWILQGNLDESERCCEEAVKILNTSENLFLRGRIYRFLGDIQFQRGNRKFAKEYYRISIGAHEIVSAEHEIGVTREKLEIVEES